MHNVECKGIFRNEHLPVDWHCHYVEYGYCMERCWKGNNNRSAHLCSVRHENNYTPVLSARKLVSLQKSPLREIETWLWTG